MGELRSAIAIARKDIRNLSRYRVAVASMAFTPLYQFVIPAFLFGAAFSVGGRAPGLVATLGTDDLAGFIFLGGVIGGIVSTAFWGMAMSIRNEMDMGTLEPSWITPTAHETFVIGRAAGGLVIFVATQGALLSMVGVAYILAAIVLLIREANFFIDTANFLFVTASGVSFPVTLLPGVLQPVALALPTTYAVDILRAQALGSRPLFGVGIEYAFLIAGTLVAYPLGRWAFSRAERTMRRRGMLAMY